MTKRLLSFAVLVTALSFNAFAASNTPPLFNFDGKSYQIKDLPAALQQAYHDVEIKAKEGKESILDQAMLDIYLKQEAEKTKKSVEEVRKALLSDVSVDDSDVQAFYDRFKDRIGLPFEDVKSRIRETLKGQKAQQKLEALITELKSKGRFVSLLSGVNPPVFNMDLAGYPTKGNAKAPIQLVEFADYRCSYCKTARDAVNNVLKDYPDQVQLIYVDYPVLDRGVAGASTDVAKAAYCAGQQDQYWAFHNKLYDSQSPLNSESATAIAKELSLKPEAFSRCMASDTATDYVQKASKLAHSVGVSGTPTFFINGQRQNFKNLEKDLRVKIEQALVLEQKK